MPDARTGARTLALFNYDWDQTGFGRWVERYPLDVAGFDLFTFPSNAQLAWFDLERFVDRLVSRARTRNWQAVVSNHEQFGALAAAMLAERMGWPGTSVDATLACQHKLHARTVLEKVCPEANLRFQPLDCAYGDEVPEGLPYPLFVKPIKAAFSVLAAHVSSRDELHAHTRFGAWELWVIRHLVEPFERIMRQRLPQAGSAHRLMLEEPIGGNQYNLDGYAFDGQVHQLGVVQAVMYPGTDAFMRFDYPSDLSDRVQAQAMSVARRFLDVVGFRHGLFNMEFFHDPASGRLTVIEFNPRMGSQLSDLYRRVHGYDMHHMALELAWGRDPGRRAVVPASAGAAASFVYRIFHPDTPFRMPDGDQRARFAREFPDGLLLEFPKAKGSIARDFKWLRSYRYAIIHLGGKDARDLRERCQRASAIFGWPAPYADIVAEPILGKPIQRSADSLSLETKS